MGGEEGAAAAAMVTSVSEWRGERAGERGEDRCGDIGVALKKGHRTVSYRMVACNVCIYNLTKSREDVNQIHEGIKMS